MAAGDQVRALLGTFWEDAGHMLGTCRDHADSIWQSLGLLWDVAGHHCRRGKLS